MSVDRLVTQTGYHSYKLNLTLKPWTMRDKNLEHNFIFYHVTIICAMIFHINNIHVLSIVNISGSITWFNIHVFSPIAVRMVKTPLSFDHSECNRFNPLNALLGKMPLAIALQNLAYFLLKIFCSFLKCNILFRQ